MVGGATWAWPSWLPSHQTGDGMHAYPGWFLPPVAT
jgi:hypothetical protein